MFFDYALRELLIDQITEMTERPRKKALKGDEKNTDISP
jgi:hypothetical protein|tara:strand:- start:60 stop:176 length:117 start_codon:yes stop_codon:yes gene_type:complete